MLLLSKEKVICVTKRHPGERKKMMEIYFTLVLEGHIPD